MPATSIRCTSLALVMLLLSFASPAAAESEVHLDAPPVVARVYLLSGQSNMAGSGQANELSRDWRQPIKGAFICHGNKYEAMDPDKLAIQKKRFGPEIGFAHYIVNNQPQKQHVFIIKFALSGQPLDAGWGAAKADGGGWAGPEPGPNRKTFYPGVSPKDPNIGLHYQRLHQHVAAAMKHLKDKGYLPKLQGIVWMQGEADAKHEVSAGRYDRSLALLKARLEEDFTGGKNVPFVFGQVLPHEPALERFTSRELIRQRMADADWNSGTKHAIDNVWMVPTEGMELLKDTVHYSTKGQLALGQAFGVKMLEAHRKAEEDAKQ